MQEVLDRLEAWLKKHRHHFWVMLLPGASPAELTSVEKTLGFPLPAELRALLAWHNGQSENFIGGFEGKWQLLSAWGIARTFAFLRAPEAEWQAAWIPFMQDDSGNFMSVDTSQPGSPVCADWAGTQKHEVIAPSISHWLRELVEAVEADRYVEEPERGTFMRRTS